MEFSISDIFVENPGSIHCRYKDEKDIFKYVQSKVEVIRKFVNELNEEYIDIVYAIYPIEFAANQLLKYANVLSWEHFEYVLQSFEEIFPMRCPKEGSFVAYKSAEVWEVGGKIPLDVLVTLEVPEDAKRSSAFTNKCRCSKARVLSINGLRYPNTRSKYDQAYSNYHLHLKYKKGEMIYPDKFDENRWNECSNGIHFFMTKEEAIQYANRRKPFTRQLIKAQSEIDNAREENKQ